MQFNIIMKEKLKSDVVLQYSFSNEKLIYYIKHPYEHTTVKFGIEVGGYYETPLFKLGYADGVFNKCTSNLNLVTIRGLSHLILDYDNKECIYDLIKKFKNKFKKYEFYLYTTKSSDKIHNRFRVIFPLKEMIRPIDLKTNRDKLIKKFTIESGDKSTCFDETCLNENQYQMMPYCEYKWNYTYCINRGKNLLIKSNIIEEINFKSFPDMDSETIMKYEKGKEIFNRLINKGLLKKFQITKKLKEEYKEFMKDTYKEEKVKLSLYDFVIYLLKKNNLEKNGYNVATKLGFINAIRHGCYDLREIKETYRKILGKEMSDNKLLKYYRNYEKVIGENR